MTEEPHSREWYGRVARELGGYRHPWSRTLDGPDPERTFDALLEERLGPDVRVLEAGCGHGPDAARFGGRVARWVAYDREPELLDLARGNAPHAEFSRWDGHGEVPDALAGPFDLIVSRRGQGGGDSPSARSRGAGSPFPVRGADAGRAAGAGARGGGGLGGPRRVARLRAGLGSHLGGLGHPLRLDG